MKATAKYRITRINKAGRRKISLMNERQLQKFRAKRLKTIRKDELGMTQKDFAEVVGVNLRTLQDWEVGRSPMPKPVEILMTLMREIPAVKKRLIVEAK